MKKRNVTLSLVTSILIVILIGIWCFSFALIWGRIFAENMPDTFLTKLWSNIRCNCLAMGFMSWLRQSPLYAALNSAARDTDGALEPLKYLLELMGAVSFVISAVNEIKSTRSFGMMMNDVIKYVFPFHFFIQAPLYAILAVTGCYACLKNVGIAATFCLLGVVICFIYSLFMAWCLFFSPKAKERMVKFYIKGIMKNKSFENVHSHSNVDIDNKKIKWQRSAGTCVLDYAKYIGQQWNSGTNLQIHRDNHLAPEGLLINLIVCGLTADMECLEEEFSHKNNENRLDIAASFQKIFPTSESYGQRDAEYVLFEKVLHFMKDEDVEGLQQNVRRCSQVWDQLFLEVENNSRQAQLAYAMFWIARDSKWQIFTVLTLGLLTHLGIARTEYADPDIKQTLEKKLAFLYDIQQSASVTIPEEYMDSTLGFNDAWGEVIFLTAGILQWMVVLNCITEDVGGPLISDLLAVIQRNMSDSGITHLIQCSEKYVVLAYILFSFDNPEKHRDLSAYILQCLEPVVCRKLNFLQIRKHEVI